MGKRTAGAAATATLSWASRFLWLLVLTPVLAISGYSLFYVARHLGVPAPFALGMSTVFDGGAILCADYSLKYAQEGLSGSVPRTAVRILALIGAYVQTFHARLGGELSGAWVLWASLPLVAVTIYEIHLRWERRKALAAAGVIYPASLPAFGLATWVLFPFKTIGALRTIVGDRREAMIASAKNLQRVTVKASEASNVKHTVTPPARPRIIPAQPTGKQRTAKAAEHSPVKHIRQWAREQTDADGFFMGWKVSVGARIPQRVIERYWAESQAAEAEES